MLSMGREVCVPAGRLPLCGESRAEVRADMPYRIQLEFDPEITGSRSVMLEVFARAGGVVDPELKGLLGMTTLVDFPEFTVPVLVLPPAPASTPYVELSWGMPPDEVRGILADLLLVADRVEADLFDPQVQAYVRGDTLARVRTHDVTGAAVHRLLYLGLLPSRTDDAESGLSEVPLEYVQGEVYRGDPVLSVRISDLELSVRASRVLAQAEIHYIGELITRSPEQLIELRNFGRKTLHELEALLEVAGLTLGMRVLDWC